MNRVIMAVTLKITTPVNTKLLGPAVLSKNSSTVYANYAAPSGNAKASAGQTPKPTAPDGSDPNGNPAHYLIVRNNRIIGPFAELRVASDTIDWIAAREREFGIDL